MVHIQYVYPFIEIIFYSILGDSITFTCILQRKLNLSHSFFSCCDRWSWGKVCILVECQLLKLCHHTSQLGFHFLVAFKRSVWNKLVLLIKSKPSLKIRTANAICWIYFGVFRDYSIVNIFIGIKSFWFSR